MGFNSGFKVLRGGPAREATRGANTTLE